MPIEVVDMTPQGIAKMDEDAHLVFGYFNVAVRKDGQLLTDLHDDQIEPAELEKAAYEFVKAYGLGGEGHKGEADKAVLVESIMLTPEKLEAMGIAKDAVPARWWGGFHIPGAEAWQRVKDGTNQMFSIEGTATRVPV